jgi:cytochrome c556
MVWVLEPAADVLWDNAGYVITADGEQDLQPTTQDGWDRVRDAATVVAETGNLLMMPGYAEKQADWQEYARGLTAAGLQARQAALNQDADALFQAGANVYSVCRACHNRYMNQEVSGL